MSSIFTSRRVCSLSLPVVEYKRPYCDMASPGCKAKEKENPVSD
jgi:hypothetical protein